MKIFKYQPVSAVSSGNLLHKFVAVMPKGAKVLSAEAQYGKLIFWAAVVPDNEPEAREFAVLMTGEEFDVAILHSHRFINTVLLDDQDLVLHIFEKK